MTELEERQGLFLSFAGALGAGLFVWWLMERLGTEFSTTDFVNPESVADIAASLPSTEDDFILSAWDYVAGNIQYQGYSSNLYFVNDAIKCTGCRIPDSTLKSGKGNCVSMSSVLASILRNRLPPERVFMVVGQMSLDGIGGHAWVNCQRRDERWYLLESTNPPKGWVPMEAVSYIYKPFAYFNDALFYCYSDEICRVKVRSCDCKRFVLR